MQDGRPVRTLVVVDQYTRECLAARIGRRLNSEDVIDVHVDLSI
jgi:transposase InsO family protein